MKTTGSVYVLANSAMPGLVKVGKTQRSATERAQELLTFHVKSEAQAGKGL